MSALQSSSRVPQESSLGGAFVGSFSCGASLGSSLGCEAPLGGASVGSSSTGASRSFSQVLGLHFIQR